MKSTIIFFLLPTCWLLARILVPIILGRKFKLDSLENSTDSVLSLLKKLKNAKRVFIFFGLRRWSEEQVHQAIKKTIPDHLFYPIIKASSFCALGDKTVILGLFTSNLKDISVDFHWELRVSLLDRLVAYQNTASYTNAVSSITNGYSAYSDPEEQIRMLKLSVDCIHLLVAILGSSCPDDFNKLEPLAIEQHNIVCLRQWQSRKIEHPKDLTLWSLEVLHRRMLGEYDRLKIRVKDEFSRREAKLITEEKERREAMIKLEELEWRIKDFNFVKKEEKKVA